MKFVRAIWELLVGIKDALVLIFMLLFFGFLYAALSARPTPVKDGVLALELKGSVVEQPAKADFADLAGGSRVREYRLRDLVAALDQARDDERGKAVALDLDGFMGGGQTAMGDLAVAMPGGSNLYFKGLLDKLGVTANVYRVGTYKSAVEPYIRNDMSPEARENYQALGGALLESWRESIHRSRPKANVDLFLNDMNGAIERAGGDMAQAALAAGLVDRIGDRRQFEERLVALGGKPRHADESYSRIKFASYVSDTVKRKPNGPIGVVTVAGTIVDGKAGAGTAGGDSIAEAIEDGIRDGKVKALVVRVDI